MNFSGTLIPDPEGKFFWEIFINYLKNLCSFNFFLIRLAPETIRSKKKVGFIFYASFYVLRIRDENFWDPDPASGKENLGIRDKTSRIRSTILGIREDADGAQRHQAPLICKIPVEAKSIFQIT
jgi:hypothetical protein